MPNSPISEQSSCQIPASDGIPIVFGVTGHRDIPQNDVPILHEAVRGYFKKVVEQYPNSQIVLLSALAEGADRIAARAAMDAGCRLGVFLPFTIDEYLNDFQSEVSKQEFRALLAVPFWRNVSRHVASGLQRTRSNA